MVLPEIGPGPGEAFVSRQIESSWPPVKVPFLVCKYEENVVTTIDGAAFTNPFLSSCNRARPKQITAYKRRCGQTCRGIDE